MAISIFYLERIEDPSGVSGTGKVAEGVRFSDGPCVLRWLTATSSIAIYDSLEDLEKIHGHDGKTRIVLLGGECVRTAFDLCSECKHRKPLIHDDCEIRRDFRITAGRHGVRWFTIGRCPEFVRVSPVPKEED